MHLTSKQWTAFFVAVVVLIVIIFSFQLYRSTTFHSRQTIMKATESTKASLSLEERARIVRSTSAQPASTTMSVEEREKIIRATSAR